MGLNLRPAAPGDLPACLEIYRAAWSGGDAHALRESFREEEVWIAEREDVPAGFVGLCRPHIFLHSLFVHPLCQRRGIGSALLELVVRRCGGHAELKCQESNRSALQFYAGRGWRPVGWGWSPDGPWIRLRY